MKPVKFRNRLNKEVVVCEDVKKVHVIDGIEYLFVHKQGQERTFLMRREALDRVRNER